jgi:hypothetical protein
MTDTHILARSGRKYIRYVYPYFGTTAPHSTSVIQFIAGDNTPLPPSACQYSFIADIDSVIQQFSKWVTLSCKISKFLAENLPTVFW